MNIIPTMTKTITNTKLVIATIFLGIAALAAAGIPKGTNCPPNLMNIAFEKNTILQGGLNEDFASSDNTYITKYRKNWNMTTGDFDNFTAPVGTAGVSIAVPALFLNGGPGMAPPLPVLKKTAVLISGYHAEWTQKWIPEQCIESGEIKFSNGPVKWSILYQGNKNDLRVIKAMIYSIRFLKN